MLIYQRVTPTITIVIKYDYNYIYIYIDSYNNIRTIYTNSVAWCHLMVSQQSFSLPRGALQRERGAWCERSLGTRTAREVHEVTGGVYAVYPLVNVYRTTLDWFVGENLNRKPWISPWNMGLSCKFSLKPIQWHNELLKIHPFLNR